MQIKDPDQLENKETQTNRVIAGRVTEANVAEVRKRLKDIVLKKSRERLSLLEKCKKNIITRAEERKNELINIAAINYDLDKEKIEEKYKEQINVLQIPKSDSESNSAFSAFAFESKSIKTSEDLIKERNAIFERLDSVLHFSEEEKSRIKDSLALKALKDWEKIKELKNLNKGTESFLANSETNSEIIQQINSLKTDMQVELLELEKRFNGAVKNAEEEHQKIMKHLLNVTRNVLVEKRKTLAFLRQIDSADVKALEAMLNKEISIKNEKMVLTNKDVRVQSNVIRTLLLSTAAVTLFGVAMYTMNKKEKVEPVLKAPAIESVMRSKANPHVSFQKTQSPLNSTQSQLKTQSPLNSSNTNNPEKVEQVKTQISPAKKTTSPAKIKKSSILKIEKMINELEKIVNLMLLIERNKKQLDKMPEDGILFLKKSTKSIAKKFLSDLQTELMHNKLEDEQKVALSSMLNRMNILLAIKEKNKKTDIRSLRLLREVSAENFSLNSIRKVRKEINKEINRQKS